LCFTEQGHAHALPRDDKLIFFSKLASLLSKGHILLLLPKSKQNKLGYTYTLVAIKEKVPFGIK